MVNIKKILLLITILLLLILYPNKIQAKESVPTIVADLNTGRILYQNKEKEKHLIASTTKIMTCLVALDIYDLEEKITVGEEILEIVGTNIYIEVGEEITVKDLLYGLMLRSGNDAAIVLASHIGIEQFIEKMNQKAKEIGMTDTIFENSHGLDDETSNTSTAYDMMLLAKYAYQNKIYQEIIQTKKYKTKTNLKSYIWYNRMSLLTNYKYCIGGKNGYTPKAGKTLVSYAKKENRIFVIVTLDDNNLYTHHRQLYEEFFKNYQDVTIIDEKTFSHKNQILSSEIYVKDSFHYLLREEEFERISLLIEITDEKKEKIGKLIIKLDNTEIGFLDIYKKQEKKKKDKNIFQKLFS